MELKEELIVQIQTLHFMYTEYSILTNFLLHGCKNKLRYLNVKANLIKTWSLDLTVISVAIRGDEVAESVCLPC